MYNVFFLYVYNVYTEEVRQIYMNVEEFSYLLGQDIINKKIQS